MLEFQQIKDQFPASLQGFEKAILREYLQYKVLQAIFESSHASQLAFLGGTALRILYGNNRFSEDIDLDNFGLSWEAFSDLSEGIRRFLELEGFQVEIQALARDAFHCHIRFPALLYQQGLSPLPGEKILIQVDSAAQFYTYQPEIKLLNKFDVYTQVRAAPLALLLSQKIYTAVNRKRAKGRDFYDISFLFSRVQPDYDFLQQKMGITSPQELRAEFRQRIAGYDFQLLARDVAPFLIQQDQVQRVLRFQEFWEQVDLGENP